MTFKIQTTHYDNDDQQRAFNVPVLSHVILMLATQHPYVDNVEVIVAKKFFTSLFNLVTTVKFTHQGNAQHGGLVANSTKLRQNEL